VRLHVTNPKDLYAGLIFLAIGVAAIWKSTDYEMGTATHMAPGYFPTCLGLILAALGAASVVRGIVSMADEPIVKRSIQPLILIVVGVFGFALLIDRAGLVPAIFVLLLFSCLPRALSHPLEILVTFVVLAASSVAIFIYGFGMPFRAFWTG
jgi:hypothetical protein